MKSSMKIMLAALLGTVFLFLPPAYAQEGADVFTLDEIIVTATKREESIFEVPVTVSAFDSDKIQQLGMISMDDLNMLAPGLQIGESTEMRDQGWVIRGIGSRLWGENHSDQAVAFYVDGIYTNAPIGIAPGMFDIDRIEVARGPQGTLHGRNSIAGSVSWFNKKPTAEWDAEVMAEVTDQFSQRYGVAFGGPIAGNLSFRITGHYNEGEGIQQNIGPGPDLGAADDLYHAEQLRYKTDRFDINLRYAKTHNKGKPRTQINLASLDPEDTFEVWQSGTEYNPYYLWNYAELGDPFPAVANCNTAEMPFATKWQRDDEGIGLVPSDAKYYYFNHCDDLRNIVNLDYENRTETINESASLSFDWHVFDWLSARFVYGQSRIFTVSSREDDNNSRVSGWADRVQAGEMVTWPPAVAPGGKPRLAKYWMLDPWSWNWQIGVSPDSERQLFRLSHDAGAYFLSRFYENPYNLFQQSGEFVLFSDFDGPLNFIFGVFYYENQTSYEHNTYERNVWYQNRGDIGWEEFQEENSPHNWDINVRIGDADYDGEYGPDASVAYTDANDNTSFGWYPFTQAGCDDFMEDITRALAAADDGDPTTYVCLPFDEDPANRHHTYHWQTRAISDTKGIFAHLGWEISDKWSVAGGARFTEDYKRKTGDTTWYLAAAGIEEAGAGGLLPQFRRTNETEHLFPITWDKFIWDLAVEYNFAETNMAYLRVATGYRAGGPQNQVPDYVDISPIVEEETLINYEIGLKGSLFDQKLWFTTGAFYSPYEGFQLEQEQEYPEYIPVPADDADPLLNYIANIDGTEIWGFEMDFNFNVTERFTLSGFYIYMGSSLGENASIVRGDPNPPTADWYYLTYPGSDYPWYGREGEVMAVSETPVDILTGEFAKPLSRAESLERSLETNLPCRPQAGDSGKRFGCWRKIEAVMPTDKTGNQLAMQPAHKWSLTAAYTMPMPNLGMKALKDMGYLQFLTTYSYTGKRHPYIANHVAHEMPGYGEMNVRTSWWSPTGRWSGTLWISNFFDDVNLISYTPATVGGDNQDSVATLSNPRRIGLTIRYKY